MPNKIEGLKKIAILRANALGDFIVTLPAIQALRNTYPGAEIILLGKPWHKDFLKKGRSPVDRVIVVPIMQGIREEKGKMPDPSEIADFFTSLKKEKLDAAVHFQGQGISANPFLKKTLAIITAGLASPDVEKPDRYVPFYYYQNEVTRYLEVASLLGAVPTNLEPEINILPEDMAEAEKLIYSLKTNDPIIVIHPGSVDRRRMWLCERFSAVANNLAEAGFAVIFTGSQPETVLISEIQANMQQPSFNAAGKLSLGGLAGLFAKTKIVISVDTGPLHLARAAGAKTVGLYWAPNLINWGPLTRKKHFPVISWCMECPHCGTIPNDPFPFLPTKSNCDHNFSFIKDITVSQVLNAIKTLLYL